MVHGPRLWLTNCDGPGAQPARNAAHDEFASLHLLWHNTGLGTQRALFELHHCDIPPEERADLIDRIRREVEAETAQKKAAQAGVAQRYREHNNDQQRLYVCACCGERNKEDTGKYTRVQLSALRFKWVSAAHCQDSVSACREKRSAKAVRVTLNDNNSGKGNEAHAGIK
jgi:hypothetical protein